MSFLNSTLIEGTLTADPAPTAINGLGLQCTFTIDSGPDAPGIPITINGKLAESLSGLLYKGRTVRIVGKIKTEPLPQAKTFQFYIQAEHVEVRPIFKQGAA
jgi:single-stranded DNA-binding protein